MKKLMTGLVLFSLVLAGCGKGGGTTGDEKQRFIDATVEVTCLIFQSEDLTDPSLEQKSKDVFKKFGFDVEDEKGMEAIATKYQDDKDVQDAVTKALEKCGGDLFKNLSEDAAAPADTDAPAADSEAPAETK